MNFAMAFCDKDKAQVTRWLSWVEELGGLAGHRLFLMPFKGLKADFKTNIPFQIVEDAEGRTTDWGEVGSDVRCAAGPNSMLRQFAWFFYPLNGPTKFGPWMFIEPDCIPLRAGWADELEREYLASGKYFMGGFVKGIPDLFPDHATGNMIFPERVAGMSQRLMLPTHAKIAGNSRSVELAFDVAAAPDILGKHFHETRLLQHVFRGPPFEKMDDLVRLNSVACLFHTDKDGGLIRLLRQRRQGIQEAKKSDCKSETGATPAPVTKPKVHTYFRPCVDKGALAEQKRILEIWEKNWREHGWEPVILTEADAKKHPCFKEYQKAFSEIPTVNPLAYEQAAWTRWIAMAFLDGCGSKLMVDYDVLVNGELELRVPGFNLPLILSDKNPVPCAVMGAPLQFENAIKAFIDCPIGTEQGKPHLSDQLAVQKLKFPAVDICREFGKPGWKDAKLIHFSHAACGQKRSQRMYDWMHGYEAPAAITPASIADCIAALSDFAKKDVFAKGRIIKQLKKAGFVSKK